MSTANVTIEQRDARTGMLIRPVVHVANRILPKGIKAAAYVLIGGPPLPAPADLVDSDSYQGYGYVPWYIGIGTDNTEVRDGDETLGTEVFRNAITRRGQKPGKVRYQLHVLATQANGYTITEIGLFLPPNPDASPTYSRIYSSSVDGITPLNTGILFARALIPAFAKTDSDTMTLTWDIPISNQSWS
jgi:hypothetical protein